MDEQKKTAAKVADKAFYRLIFTSFLAIFVCIVCLCSSTFAWFYDSAPSVGNSLKAMGECLLTVTVEQGDVSLPAEKFAAGIELEAGVEYTVTLSLPRDSASGYCLISADGRDFYSPYLTRHEDEEPTTVSFTLTVETTRVVKLTTRWGIYSRDCDVVDETLNIP